MALIVLVSFLLYCVSGIAALAVGSRLITTLLRDHVEFLADVDPSGFRRTDAISQLRLFRALWRRDYMGIGDAALVRLAEWSRALYITCFASFSVFAASLIWRA